MKFNSSTTKAAIAATGIAAATLFSAATAAAIDPTVQTFGTAEQLNDGPLVTTYTVSNLQRSTVTIPGFTPAGQLWQADVSAAASSGTVNPLVNFFNARSADGQNYRVLDTVSAPNGLSPAPLSQGAQTTGEIYFDVTGAKPDSVVYNDGVEDVLIWTNSPANGQSNGTGTSQGNGAGTSQGNGAGTGQDNGAGTGQDNGAGTGNGNGPAASAPGPNQ